MAVAVFVHCLSQVKEGGGKEEGKGTRENIETIKTHLRMMMTMMVMTAARKTKPPKTPSAMMPPMLRRAKGGTEVGERIFESEGISLRWGGS